MRTVRRCVRTFVRRNERTRRPPRIKLNAASRSRTQKAHTSPGIGREKKREKERLDGGSLLDVGPHDEAEGERTAGRGFETASRIYRISGLPPRPDLLVCPWIPARRYGCAPERTTLLTACFFYRNFVFASCPLHVLSFGSECKSWASFPARDICTCMVGIWVCLKRLLCVQ